MARGNSSWGRRNKPRRASSRYASPPARMPRLSMACPFHIVYRTRAQTVASQRQTPVWSCISASNLVQLRAAKATERRPGGTRAGPSPSHCVLRIPESTTQKGTSMKCASVVKVAAAAAVVIGLVGCQDLKPMQSDIADLKSQVAQLQSQVAASKSSADQAASAAQSASQAASGAQSTANQALAAAQAAHFAVDATNEKINRMFKRSISK